MEETMQLALDEARAKMQGDANAHAHHLQQRVDARVAAALTEFKAALDAPAAFIPPAEIAGLEDRMQLALKAAADSTEARMKAMAAEVAVLRRLTTERLPQRSHRRPRRGGSVDVARVMEINAIKRRTEARAKSLMSEK